jgi:hypothetical protein
MERLRMVAPDVFNSMGLPSLPPGLLPPAAAAATNGVPGSPASSPSSATAAAAAPGAGQPAQADVFSQFMTQVSPEYKPSCISDIPYLYIIVRLRYCFKI